MSSCGPTRARHAAPTCDADWTPACRPVRVVPDPIRGGDSVLVLCMVMSPDGTAHETNQRQALMDILDDEILAEEPLYGFEQEYTMMKGNTVYGWPMGGTQFPAPQGPFYCGVGAESVFGRPLAEAHLDACIKAGLTISGINAEVMPGQWEFQIGPSGPLDMPDEVRSSASTRPPQPSYLCCPLRTEVRVQR
jgi:glutamine synthetase